MSSEQATVHGAEHDTTFKNKGAMLSHYKLAKPKEVPAQIDAELGLPRVVSGNSGARAEQLWELRQAIHAPQNLSPFLIHVRPPYWLF